MKKFAALLIFTVVFLLVGCGGFVPQNAGKDTALPTGTVSINLIQQQKQLSP